MVSFLRLFRQRKFGLILIVCLSLLAVSLSSGVIHADVSSSPSACAVTPTLLGGQGFRVSGQGFRVSGQGFRVSGQGFSVSDQGFRVSGQGLDPKDVTAEILDNPVTPGKWVTDRLDFFMKRLGFNNDATAIIIVDEFTPLTVGEEPHGEIVQKVVDDSIGELKKAVPSLKIDSFSVDISDVNTNYNADAIEAKIAAKVSELQHRSQPYPYSHFVLNMSFGLITCSDSGTATTPAFNFNDATKVVVANNKAAPSLAITPVLECVAKVSSGDDDDHHPYGGRSRVSDNSHGGGSTSYVAYFGYQNANDQLVKIPIGYGNKFSPSPDNQSQPNQFEPGQQHFVFAVKFSGSDLKWSVKGPDGQTRTVTANKYSTPCATPIPAPTQPVTPVVECVANLGSGNYEAHFGYKNPNALGVNTAVGYSNKFTPSPTDRGQVTTFVPGVHEGVFKVPFNGSDLKWTLGSINVIANTNTVGCPEQEGFGVSQYLTQNLGVPDDQLGDYWNHLADPVTGDDFQKLRQLLRTYLNDSADPSKNFSAVIVASSGNLRPWLGPEPLAPASWNETIAVGATLDDSTSKWSFMQDGNVLAPGVGYPLGDNSYAAGTSFSAPAFSVLVGMCSTVPNALKFKGGNPPLEPGATKADNKFIDPANFAPLSCKPNSKPTISPISDRNEKEGTAVSFQVSATDPDVGDVLTYSAVGLPQGVNISSSGLISGTIGNNTAGTYSVTVTVTDNVTPLVVTGTAFTTFNWVVTAAQSGVKIDIRPYSASNRINLSSPGLVAVAIFGSSTFDATAIDPSTVTLAGAPAVKLFGKFYTLTFDINHDGKIDRILWFQATKLQLTATSIEAVLLGKTAYGLAFRGVDKVKIVTPSAPHLTSPANGATVSDWSVNLKWTDDQDWEVGDNVCYALQISKSAGFTNLVMGAIVVDRESVSTIPLSNGTYYWRVAFSDCSVNTLSPWSSVWNFKVQH